jgi:hypothetical protein
MNPHRPRNRRLLTVLALVCAAWGGLHGARAAEPELAFSEMRTFDIFVDGKKSGQSKLSIASYRDGTETVKADAKISVNWLVFNYVYEFHNQEQWRSGVLQELSSNAVDGGEKMSLKVSRTDTGYSIAKSRGKPEAAAEIHFTTNYWRQPPIDPQGRPMAVLDADTGAIYQMKIQPLGQRELTVASQAMMASGFRLEGKLIAELWFDPQGLLVHQTGKEDGHPTEVRLVSIQRPAAAPGAANR